VSWKGKERNGQDRKGNATQRNERHEIERKGIT
jgi:hypothetical protein